MFKPAWLRVLPRCGLAYKYFLMTRKKCSSINFENRPKQKLDFGVATFIFSILNIYIDTYLYTEHPHKYQLSYIWPFTLSTWLGRFCNHKENLE